MEKCSVGQHLGTDCHLLSFPVNTTGIIHCHELSERDRTILQIRSGASISEESTACFHHTHLYLSNFYTKEKKQCYDPLNRHGRKPVKKSLLVISFEDMQKLLSDKGRQVICGQKVCHSCWSILLHGKTEQLSKMSDVLVNITENGANVLPQQTKVQDEPNDAELQSLETAKTKNIAENSSANVGDKVSTKIYPTEKSNSQNDDVISSVKTSLHTNATAMAAEQLLNLDSRNALNDIVMPNSPRTDTPNENSEMLVDEAATNTVDKTLEVSTIASNVQIQNVKLPESNAQIENDEMPVDKIETNTVAKQSSRHDVAANNDQIPTGNLELQETNVPIEDSEMVVEKNETNMASKQLAGPETVISGLKLSESSTSFQDSEMPTLQREDRIVNEVNLSAPEPCLDVEDYINAKRTHPVSQEGSPVSVKRARGRPKRSVMPEGSPVGFKRNRDRPKSIVTAEDVEHSLQVEGTSSTPQIDSTRISENGSQERPQETPNTQDNVEIRVPKRCLMLNVRELHACYSARHPKNIASFSEVCMLRPNWCVTSKATTISKGSICELHENVKLMVNILPARNTRTGFLTYKDLLQKLLCFHSTPLCRVGKCARCPNVQNLKKLLLSNFDLEDFDPDDHVRFHQWVCRDTMQLELCTATVEEYADKLCAACLDLLEHHEIAKAQSSHYKHLQETLTHGKAIIVMDFAENYHLPTFNNDRDVVWGQEAVTLLTMHITYLDHHILQTHKLCVISDYKEHDASMIYASIYEAMLIINTLFPFIKTIYYFSDDSNGQYRSKTNLLNLCHHSKDFGITAEWHFFGSGHGKRLCSYISGHLKKQANMAVTDITNASDLYEWAKVNILEIQVLFVSAARVGEISSKIEDRLHTIGVISGLRCFHAFVPLLSGNSSLLCGITSKAKEWKSKNLCKEKCQIVYEEGTYVSFMFDCKWWIGMIDDATEDHGEYVVRVMQPRGPADSFFWPDYVHKCLVPSDNILCEVIPVVHSGSGKKYTFTSDRFKEPVGVGTRLKEIMNSMVSAKGQ